MVGKGKLCATGACAAATLPDNGDTSRRCARHASADSVRVGSFLSGIAAGKHMSGLAGIGGVLTIAGAICSIVAAFKIRDAMESITTAWRTSA
jgi:hypothetical protein